MGSFSPILDPSFHGMLLDTIEDFDVVATFGAGAVLYPARYTDSTNLPENLHAALAATSLRLRSLDYAKTKYGQTASRRSGSSSHDLYMDAYRLTKSHMRTCADAFRANTEIELRLGTFASSVALKRLVTSMLGVHILYRIGLNYEGDAVARHVLEQIAWAVAASDLDDEDDLRRLSATRSVGALKSLASYAGPLYGRLSKTTHASLVQHHQVVRSEGEAVSILLTWGRPAWSALTLLQLADLWVLAYEWTQRDHMTSFIGLNPAAGYEPLPKRAFLDVARKLVSRIETEEASERDPDGGGQRPDDASMSAGGTDGVANTAPIIEDRVDWDAVLAERRPPDGIIAARVGALDDLVAWTGAGIASRLRSFNVSTRAKNALLSLAPDADLRTVRLPGLDTYAPVRHAILSRLVFAPGYRFLEPWLRGTALGVLADLQVYSSNARSKWTGKAHAPGHCQHSSQIRDDDDLLSLTEWIAIHAERQITAPFDDWICSKCGGFAVRLLSEDQAEYFHRARDLSDEFKRIEFYERELGSRARGDSEYQGAAERALDVASAIAAVCPELRVDCVALARRAARIGDVGLSRS